MFQLFVPDATPDPPVEVVHVTCEIPRASCAVPLTTIDAAEVETIVVAGDRIVKDGGAPPGLGLLGGLGFAGGLGLLGALGFPEVGLSATTGWLVTVTLCDAWSPFESWAVTVITFAPILNGMAAMIQLDAFCEAETSAVPAAP